MEAYQIDLIRSNLSKLVRNTNCNDMLLYELEGRNILGLTDMDEIQYTHKTPKSRVRKLYDILETRKNSFDALVEALKATNQTGAVDILLQTTAGIPNHGLIEIDKNRILGTGLKGNKVFLGTFDYRRVAVKVVREEEALTEVQHLRSLKVHDNIIRYYFAENRNGLTYIAIELCEITLAEEIDSKKFNIEPTAILKKCNKGMAFLHRENVIHRDLKPTNILINHDKQIKISDFGFSIKINPAASAIEICDKFGTPHWMAPEVLQTFMTLKPVPTSTKPKMSRRSDIFSLGCIFFFVLSNGDHPFGSNLANIYNRILNGRPDSLPEPLNDPWGLLITSMLQSLPSKRPTADEILFGNWFAQKDIKSVGAHKFMQKRVQEHEQQHARIKDEILARVEESRKEEMGGTRFSPDVYSKLSSNLKERFDALKSVVKRFKSLSGISVENKSSLSLLPDKNTYSHLSMVWDNSKLEEIAKFLREEQSICMLAITKHGLVTGTDAFSVYGYSNEFVENCKQLIYVKNSFEGKQIELPDHLKIRFSIENQLRFNIFEVRNSGKPKALICTLSSIGLKASKIILDSFNDLCEFLISQLKIGADERIIIFLDVHTLYFDSFGQKIRKLGDKFGLVEIADESTSGQEPDYLAFVKTKDRDNVVCKLHEVTVSKRKMISVTYVK